MKRPLIIALCAVLALSCVAVGVCAAAVPKPHAEPRTEASTALEPVTTVPATPDEPAVTEKQLNIAKGQAEVLGISKVDEALLTSWKSSDESVVTVDDGGRIDAVAEGKAVVTAEFFDNREFVYEITVDKADAAEDKLSFSTAITANGDVVEKNKKNKQKNLYEIYVNRIQNCVTVYTYDISGEYTVPVRAMLCSCGKNGATILGDFNIYFKHEWHPLYNSVYGQYVSGISGDYLFHSVPYNKMASDSLETDEFNKLGADASLGCVRLAAADAKWIYDNCSVGTRVLIYDSDREEPLGVPEAIKIKNMKNGWDPTDDNPDNPYRKKSPSIKGAADCTVKRGVSFSPAAAVKAYDTCGNEITGKIEIVGNVVPERAGKYRLTYSVTDALNRTAVKDVWVTVVE